MRSKEDIYRDLESAKEVYYRLRGEYRDVLTREVEEKYHIKRGDLVELVQYGRVYFCGVTDFKQPYTLYCKTVKKDGLPSSVGLPLRESLFVNCKVVGHFDF